MKIENFGTQANLGGLEVANLRLGKSYGSYRQRFLTAKKPRTKMPKLTHLQWVEAAKLQFTLRKSKRLDKVVRSSFVDKLRQSFPVGLGYIPSWKQIAHPQHLRIQTRRDKILFAKSSVVVVPSLDAGTYFLTDRAKQIALYKQDKYWYNFKKSWDESLPVGLINGVFTTVERISDGKCLTCGSHRLDGFFCCYRYCSRQLVRIQDAVVELHPLARVDRRAFFQRLSILVREGHRLMLQQHRIAWHVSLGCLPYFARFNRVFSLSQDIANAGGAVVGLEPRKKTTKGTVERELAQITMPSLFEVTERLFRVKSYYNMVVTLPYPDIAFLTLISTLRVLLGVDTNKEALFYYLDKKNGRRPPYDYWAKFSRYFDLRPYGVATYRWGRFQWFTCETDLSLAILEWCGWSDSIQQKSDSPRIYAYLEIDYIGGGSTNEIEPVSGIASNIQGVVKSSASKEAAIINTEVPGTFLRHRAWHPLGFLGNRCGQCKRTTTATGHFCSDTRWYELDRSTMTWYTNTTWK